MLNALDKRQRIHENKTTLLEPIHGWEDGLVYYIMARAFPGNHKAYIYTLDEWRKLKVVE